MFEFFNNLKICYDYYDENELLTETVYSELLNFNDDIPNKNENYKSINVIENYSLYRTNIFKWYPFKKNSRILEIHAECGAITGFLSEISSDLVSVTPSRLSAEIIKNRYQNLENLYLYVGKFIDINFDDLPFNTFDYIIVVGGILSQEELFKIKALLSDNGSILIATENKYGEQYFSGSSDSLIQNYYNGINGYLDTVYSKKTWLKNLSVAGFSEVSVKYPFPNYRFCEYIFSDDFLPNKNQLYKRSIYAGKQDLITFDNNIAFNFAIENGFFQNVSNSFFFEIGKKSNIDYVKYSIDRNEETQIFTLIENSNYKKVKKYPFTAKAYKHLKNVSGQEEKINQIFDGEFIGCPCKLEDDCIDFKFLNGHSLSYYISNSITENKTTTELFEYLGVLKNAISKISTGDKFIASKEFIEFFGKDCDGKGFTSAKYSFVDLIPENIIIDNDNKYIIDYEWVLPFPVPVEFIVFRSVFTNSSIGAMNFKEKKKVYDFLGIRIEDYNFFLELEKQFQKRLYNSKESIAETLERLSPIPYDIRLIDLKSLFYNTRIYDKSTGDLISNRITSTNGFLLFFNPGQAKEIEIILSDKNIFLSSLKITAIDNNGQIKTLDYSHNASFVCDQEMIFSSAPTLEIINEGYSEIKLQFNAYIWDSFVVDYILNKNLIIDEYKRANGIDLKQSEEVV